MILRRASRVIIGIASKATINSASENASPCRFHRLHARAYVFVAVEHANSEIIGIHAARSANRFEALEPVRQGVNRCFGSIAPGVARGLKLRHDHGSNYDLSNQAPTRTTGARFAREREEGRPSRRRSPATPLQAIRREIPLVRIHLSAVPANRRGFLLHKPLVIAIAVIAFAAWATWGPEPRFT